MALFYYFFMAIVFHCIYVLYRLFPSICQWLDLGYFHILVTVNSAGMKRGVHVSFRIRVLFGYTPILCPPRVKSWLIEKDPDAGRDWGQKEKGTTEDEMAGWHHWLDGHEFEWTPGVGNGQGGLECCNSWGCKELDMTEWLNWTELIPEVRLLDQMGTLFLVFWVFSKLSEILLIHGYWGNFQHFMTYNFGFLFSIEMFSFHRMGVCWAKHDFYKWLL